MDLLLILTYTAICIAIFKIFKIPLNKWSVPTAVLGGVILIGGLILVMNYNHPYSEMSREYFVTTPIVPNVSGQVIEVPAVAVGGGGQSTARDGSTSNVSGAGLSASWELDIWGKLGATASAAEGEYQATAADLEAAR